PRTAPLPLHDALPTSSVPRSCPGLLRVPAELPAKRREQPVLERALAARGEALEQRRGEHVDGHAEVVGGRERPAALARVRHASRSEEHTSELQSLTKL